MMMMSQTVNAYLAILEFLISYNIVLVQTLNDL
jgi:hypothetical protein